MTSRVTLDSTRTSLLHSTPSNTVHPAALDTLTLTNYSPRSIQACLDSTIMTYLQRQTQQQQQQQQQPHHQQPPLPPHALAAQQLKQQLYQQHRQHHLDSSPTLRHQQPQRYYKGTVAAASETTHRSATIAAALKKQHTAPGVIMEANATADDRLSSPHAVAAAGTTAAIVLVPHSPRDQTMKETMLSMPLQQLQLQQQHHYFSQSRIDAGVAEHNQYRSEIKVSIADANSQHARAVVEDDEDEESSDGEGSYYDDDEDDGSIYSDEVVGDSVDEIIDSETEASDSDYESENSQDDLQRSSQEGHLSANKAAELVRHATVAASTPRANGSNGAVYIPTLQAGLVGDDRPSHGFPGSNLHPRTQHSASQIPIASEIAKHGATRPTTLPNGLPSGHIMQVETAPDFNLRAARAVPYVEDEDEEEDLEEDDYKGSEDYDDDEEEDDYSYSEDEGEDDDDDDDDESIQGHHYGVREGSRAGIVAKGRSSHSGHVSRAGYPNYRAPRLDEHFLQKRAITKQVVRRSSLTALLGEASQPVTERRNLTTRPSSGAQFGQYHRHNNSAGRRPALLNVWTDDSTITTNTVQDNIPPHNGPLLNGHSLGQAQERHASEPLSDVMTDARRDSVVQSATTLSDEQEQHRPQRTDSGVGVKLSHNQRYASSSESSMDRQPSRLVVVNSTELSSLSSSQYSATVDVSSASSVVVAPIRRSRVKSDGDSPEHNSLCEPSTPGFGEQVAASSSAPTDGNISIPASKLLKSSISCHTFPRAAGKRMGQKHVSWHHSLFPTEHVLRVKPSLPSLSSIAAESAEATLSQLPSVPVMARDNVAAFHQSIRSLRTLSRIEIAKMSYKQQGRQALASPAPIPKSPSDLLPWWSPSRWIKGTVEVDKRHWKPDNSRETCAYCFAPFHRLTNPRHHCRKCGDLFCGKCANAEILMDAKNCVYVQQSQLARWSRRVDLQRHSVWIDTLPQLHPVRTAAESALVAGTDGHGSIGHTGGVGAGIGVIGGVGMGQRSFSGNGGGGGRGSWQVGSGASKRSRISIFALFGNGVPASGASNPPSDSRRSSVDFASAETVYSNHYGRLQPHSQNPLAVTFAAGRRSSSSSILRSTSVGVPSPLMIIGTPLGSSESGLPPIAMSRGMSSGGVGEVCLARICVGCERELLKPVPRCTSIAKYYGSLNSRHGYRPPLHGYSNLGPRAGRQGPQAGPLHPMDDDPTYTASHEHPVNGGRRHSPLRQTSHIDNIPAHEEHGHPRSHSRQGNYDEGARMGPDHDYGAVAQGELGYAPGVLTFQEQQLQYTQQTLGPIPRELC